MMNSDSSALYVFDEMRRTAILAAVADDEMISGRGFDIRMMNRYSSAVYVFDEMRQTAILAAVADAEMISGRGFDRRMSIRGKMNRYSSAVYMFDEMRQLDSRVDGYMMSIAIDCYSFPKRLNIDFAVVGDILFRSSYERDAMTFNTLIKGLILETRLTKCMKHGVLFKGGYEPDATSLTKCVNRVLLLMFTHEYWDRLLLPTQMCKHWVIDGILFKSGYKPDATSFF